MDPEKKKIRARRQLKRIARALEIERTNLAKESRLIKYETDGAFDYELYKHVQTLGNVMKIDNQWVNEDHIALLCRYLNDAGHVVEQGICHGTRRGREQAWFADHLVGASKVIGTEISDTATDFENTIQWDFHEVKDEWRGRIDLIYSNSWDHSYDPEKAFSAWVSCLAPGGYMLLDHGWNFLPDKVDLLDGFGISEDGLIDLLNRVCGSFGRVETVLDGGKHKRHKIRTVVFKGA
ncbi:MAG: hypothetical protein AAGJ34_00480 [Pseudomonadota bacterium]